MPSGVYKRTEECKKILSLARKGKKCSLEHRQKISEANKGKNTWSKGCKHSEITKRKISQAHSGKEVSKETRKKLSIVMQGNKNNLGNKHTKEAKRKMSVLHKGNKGSNWKGGVTNINNTIRCNIEYRLWREAVFARDNWTCQKTKVKGGKLQAHHIKNFSKHPELRFAIDNGITLSEKAHKKFHIKYGTKNNTKKQLNEFLKIKKL